MLKIISLLALLTSSLAFASEEENFICSALYVKSLSTKVNVPNVSDKYKHCSVSCMLTLRCGGLDTYSAGLLKELLDMMGMGNPEMNDIHANVAGIKLVKEKRVSDDGECMNACFELFH